MYPLVECDLGPYEGGVVSFYRPGSISLFVHGMVRSAASRTAIVDADYCFKISSGRKHVMFFCHTNSPVIGFCHTYSAVGSGHGMGLRSHKFSCGLWT